MSDKLRLSLLSPDSEEWLAWSDEQRKELIFRLFSSFVIGGALNQFDDEIKPYLDLTRTAYKEMATVQKVKETDSLEVVSWALNVTSVEASAGTLFQRKNMPNFFLVGIDPIKRRVTMWYNSYVPIW